MVGMIKLYRPIFYSNIPQAESGRHFYGTENEIWASFGPVGNTEKNWGPIMSNF